MARPRGDIEPRLIEAARGLFLVHGVDGASSREIARAAGTSLGMLVYYFPTKDDLFLAVIEESYAALTSDLEALLQRDATTADRLRAAFVRVGSSSERELEVLRLLASEALSSSSRRVRIVRRFMRGHLPFLLGALREGVARGELDAEIPLPLLALAVFGLGGMPQLLRRSLGRVPSFGVLPKTEALADLSLRLLQRAIGNPKVAQPDRATSPAR